MRARTGKIARLPQSIRQQLNERLEACQPGEQILQWLHALPEVRQLLDGEFAGDPITRQNLSHWRQGGFRDWLAHEDIRSGLAGVDDLTADWAEGRDLEIIDKATALLSARFAALLSRWDGKPAAEFDAQARALNGLCLSVMRLQKQLHQTRRDQHDLERQVKEEKEADDEKVRKKLVQPWLDAAQKLPALTRLFGGGADGARVAKYILAVQNDRMDLPQAHLKFTGDEKFDPFANLRAGTPGLSARAVQKESKPVEEAKTKPEPEPPADESNPVQGCPTLKPVYDGSPEAILARMAAGYAAARPNANET